MASILINLSLSPHSSSSSSPRRRPPPRRRLPALSSKSSYTPTSLPSLLSIRTTTTQKAAAFSAVSCSLGKLSEAELVVVPDADGLAGRFPAEAGVYAVYDDKEELQFVGISRSIAASVAAHRKSVPPELCSSVKATVVTDPDRAALTGAWKAWMEEHIQATGKVPPGNQSGNTTWVRQPEQKRKKKPDLRLTPGPHTKLTIPLEELIDRLVKENEVVAFIKGSRGAPQCGFSQRVVGILESHGVDFESVDVLDEQYNSGLRESLKRYSNWPTFPQVFVKGELVGGCDIITSMAESGELARLFSK